MSIRLQKFYNWTKYNKFHNIFKLKTVYKLQFIITCLSDILSFFIITELKKKSNIFYININLNLKSLYNQTYVIFSFWRRLSSISISLFSFEKFSPPNGAPTFKNVQSSPAACENSYLFKLFYFPKAAHRAITWNLH